MVNLKALIVWGICMPFIALAKPDISVESSVNRSSIFENETISLTLTINGNQSDTIDEIQQPDVSQSFQIVSSSQSSSFSFVNGSMSRKKSFQYQLRPLQPGIFIIDPFVITIKSKTYSTKPIRMTVKKGQSNATSSQPSQMPSLSPFQPFSPPSQTRSPSNSDAIFLEYNISTTNILIGESIDYSVTLFRRVSVWSSISIAQNDINNVWQENLPTAKETVSNRNGRRYYELELAKKTIRPLATGNITIPPLVATFVLDPFSGNQQLQTAPINVTINALPIPIPDSFTGAIGEFSLATKLPDPTIPSSSFKLTLQLQSPQLPNTIKPPVINDSSEYRILMSPQTTSKSSTLIEFDYLVLPKVSQTIVIPPIRFAYFSKSNNDYIELSTGPITLNALTNEQNTPLIENTQQDIRFLQHPTLTATIQQILNHSTLFVVLLISYISIWLFRLAYLWSKSTKNKQPSPLQHRKKTQQKINALTEASSFSEMEATLVDTLSIVCQYPSNTIHHQHIRNSLAKQGISESLINGIIQWSTNIQTQKYNKHPSQINTHSMVESLKRLCTQLMEVSHP